MRYNGILVNQRRGVIYRKVLTLLINQSLVSCDRQLWDWSINFWFLFSCILMQENNAKQTETGTRRLWGWKLGSASEDVLQEVGVHIYASRGTGKVSHLISWVGVDVNERDGQCRSDMCLLYSDSGPFSCNDFWPGLLQFWVSNCWLTCLLTRNSSENKRTNDIIELVSCTLVQLMEC